MKIINAIITVLCVIIIASCATSKSTLRPEITDESANISLEQFLVKNSNYVKIPLTKLPSGHLHLNALINGVQGTFILDTGAGGTVIDPKHQEKFNMNVDESEHVGAGAGGQATLRGSSGNVVKIGDLEISNFSIYTMSLNHVNAAFISMGLSEVDGVIGSDILTSNNGIIDCNNLTLYLKK